MRAPIPLPRPANRAMGDFFGSPKFRDFASNALIDLGYGLTRAPDIGQAFGAATQHMVDQQPARDAYAQSEAEKAERLAQINQTSEYLRNTFPDLAEAVNAGMPMDAAWSEAMKRKQPGYGSTTANAPASVQEYEFAKQNGFEGSFEEWRKGGNQTVRAGLGQPVVLINRETQEKTPFMPMSDGTYVNPLTGQAADESWMFDPASLAADKVGATEDAKTAAAARASLRGAEVSMSNTAKAVAELRNNAAGMKEWFGQFGPRGKYIHPGSEMGKFWAAADPTNNTAFMQAREMLKGGGQITDYEGRKAEDAFSRMRAALETGDEAQYLRAVDDFEAAVAEGYSKLQQAASGGSAAPTQSSGAGRPAPAANTTSSGVSWKVK
jgi:hypothetical protein